MFGLTSALLFAGRVNMSSLVACTTRAFGRISRVLLLGIRNEGEYVVSTEGLGFFHATSFTRSVAGHEATNSERQGSGS